MTTEIKMSYDQMISQITHLQNSTETFRPYTKNVWLKPPNDLAEMNSDFTKELDDSFNRMKSSKELNIMQTIDSFISQAIKLADTFKTMDEKLKIDYQSVIPELDPRPIK
jgi:hypothetical protein